jgi:predicted NAD/FAD-dependent oxidoreductase
MLTWNSQSIAVMGAGIAGDRCVHALSLAGQCMQVFDKSRGPGGRRATRARAQALLDEKDVLAVGLGDVADAERVDHEASR